MGGFLRRAWSLPWAVRDQIDELDGEIIARLAAHADGHIFASLPHAGRIRAAALALLQLL